MFGRHKRSIVRIANLLRSLEQERDCHPKLLQLQRELVRLIKRGEARITGFRIRYAALRKQLKTSRPDRQSADLLRAELKSVDEKLFEYKQLLFVWRCFGDGIAFTYVDKFAIKHVYFNTDNLDAKQGAGALSGKDGFKKEWTFVKYICKKGAPCMLSDITNTIRHGDICILIGPDPWLIEVKSSKKRNERAGRQIESLKKIHSFLNTDSADSLRGLNKPVVRQKFKTEEVTYVRQLNDCIEASRVNGYAHTSPEPGLHFLCVRDVKAFTEQKFDVFAGCMILNLNELIRLNTWAPYYPFTLAIRKSEALYEFINGELSIIAGLHIPTLLEAFRKRHIQAEYLGESADSALKLCRRGAVLGEDVEMHVSHQFLARVLIEQQSIEWFAQVQLEVFEEYERADPTSALMLTLSSAS
jgi:hypothetical protein